MNALQNTESILLHRKPTWGSGGFVHLSGNVPTSFWKLETDYQSGFMFIVLMWITIAAMMYVLSNIVIYSEPTSYTWGRFDIKIHPYLCKMDICIFALIDPYTHKMFMLHGLSHHNSTGIMVWDSITVRKKWLLRVVIISLNVDHHRYLYFIKSHVSVYLLVTCQCY